MEPYRYRALVGEEIRLIKLQPGNIEDDIHLQIYHAPISYPPIPTFHPERISVEKLQKTLPKGWIVSETLSGRYIFFTTEEKGKNSWKHPEETYDHSSYELKQQNRLIYEPNYDALSYSWGEQENRVRCCISDLIYNSKTFHLEIGQNLASALTNMRYRKKERTMWIDAICINQENVDERNIQVKRMGMIYSLSHITILWVGEATEDSDQALSTVQYFGDQVEVALNGIFGDSPDAAQPDWWMPRKKLPYNERTWQSLRTFFERSWFRRVWCLQEMQLTRQQAILQCGQTTVPWHLIFKAIAVLSENHQRSQYLRLDELRLSVENLYGQDFARILRGVTDRECSDPRDKVYGVLSLAPPSVARLIQPDYSLPVSEVYKQAFVAYFQQCRDLSMIGACTLDNRMANAAS